MGTPLCSSGAQEWVDGNISVGIPLDVNGIHIGHHLGPGEREHCVLDPLGKVITKVCQRFPEEHLWVCGQHRVMCGQRVPACQENCACLPQGIAQNNCCGSQVPFKLTDGIHGCCACEHCRQSLESQQRTDSRQSHCSLASGITLPHPASFLRSSSTKATASASFCTASVNECSSTAT